MAKIRYNALKTHLAAIGDILAEYDANRAAEATAAGDDNAGNVGEAKEIEKRDQPGAQDSAPRGAHALNNIPGYDRLRKNAPLPK
jgi:hypothetical protein